MNVHDTAYLLVKAGPSGCCEANTGGSEATAAVMPACCREQPPPHPLDVYSLQQTVLDPLGQLQGMMRSGGVKPGGLFTQPCSACQLSTGVVTLSKSV